MRSGPTVPPKCPNEPLAAAPAPPINAGGYWVGAPSYFVFVAPLPHVHLHHHGLHYGGPPSPMLFALLSADGDGEGAKYLAAFFLVAAIVGSPIAAVSLAASRPEDDSAVASTVDEINEFNEHARHKLMHCMSQPLAPAEAPP